MQGPPGLSDAWSTNGSFPIGCFTNCLTDTITTVSLPAGSYVINGDVVIANTTPNPASGISCNLVSGSTFIGRTISVAAGSTSVAATAEASWARTITLTGTTPVSIQCSEVFFFSTGGFTASAELTATAVANLH